VRIEKCIEKLSVNIPLEGNGNWCTFSLYLGILKIP